MNIESDHLERTNLQLKYCECCGGLWLRPTGSTESRCWRCVRFWKDLPGAWIKSLKQKEKNAESRRMRLVTRLAQSMGGRA